MKRRTTAIGLARLTVAAAAAGGNGGSCRELRGEHRWLADVLPHNYYYCSYLQAGSGPSAASSALLQAPSNGSECSPTIYDRSEESVADNMSLLVFRNAPCIRL